MAKRKPSKYHEINLRYLVHLAAVCDCDIKISRAADRLGVSQSVVSRNIQTLEQAFGSQLFERRGRRLVRMTPMCQALLGSIREINVRVNNLEAIAEAVLNQPLSGEIRIACTHLQARYILPRVLPLVRKAHPQIKVTIYQCFPSDINDLLMANQADIGICSEHMSNEDAMRSEFAYAWHRILIAPQHHPVHKVKKLKLEQLAHEQLITYMPGITGRRRLDAVFAEAGLVPNIVVAAADSDVIKELARQDQGVGIIASVAYEPKRDSDLQVRSLSGMLGTMQTRVVHRKDRQLTKSQQLFVVIFCREARQIAKKIDVA